jgi:hypothetical protein
MELENVVTLTQLVEYFHKKIQIIEYQKVKKKYEVEFKEFLPYFTRIVKSNKTIGI